MCWGRQAKVIEKQTQYTFKDSNDNGQRDQTDLATTLDRIYASFSVSENKTQVIAASVWTDWHWLFRKGLSEPSHILLFYQRPPAVQPIYEVQESIMEPGASSYLFSSLGDHGSLKATFPPIARR